MMCFVDICSNKLVVREICVPNMYFAFLCLSELLPLFSRDLVNRRKE